MMSGTDDHMRFGWRWWFLRLALLAVYVGTCLYLAFHNGTGA